MNEKTTDTLLVSIDLVNRVLLVGRKKPKQVVDVINAFQGEDAEKIYKMLTEKKVNHATVS